MHVQRGGVLIKSWELEATRLQLLVVDHHPGIFHVQDLHDVLPAVYENEYPAITYILVHHRGNNAAQGIEAFSHIYRHGIQVVLKGLVQMEHTLSQ